MYLYETYNFNRVEVADLSWIWEMFYFFLLIFDVLLSFLVQYRGKIYVICETLNHYETLLNTLQLTGLNGQLVPDDRLVSVNVITDIRTVEAEPAVA